MKNGLLIMAVAALSSTAVFALPNAAQEAPVTFAVDASHSSVLFRIKHLDISQFYGRFNAVAGEFCFDDKNASSNKIDITVMTESIDTNNDGRDKHLKGPDFFNTKQFPKIQFVSKSFKSMGTNGYEVTGDLTLHGVTKEITAKLERTGQGERGKFGFRSGFEAQFDIKRADFDMKYMIDGIGNEVKLIISIEGMKKA